MHRLVCALLLLSLPVLADEPKGKKGEKPKDSGQFDDLFGTGGDGKGTSLDAMKKATEGLGTKKTGDGLAPRVGTIDNDATVKFLKVFAAETIVEDKKLGCQPGGRDKLRISTWTFDEVPVKATHNYQVCLTMQSSAGREMSMRLRVVDGRGQRINNHEDVINFRGRTDKVDHVIEFPAPVFKMVGPHFYVVDIDGKEAARLPLFVVHVEGQTSGALGTTPSDLPPKQDVSPPTGEDPLKAATARDP